MNDGESESARLIKDIEREILALKTAHQRPLGALDFITKKETLTVPLDLVSGFYYKEFWLDVKIQTPDVTPPIVQTGWDVPENFYYMELLEYSVSLDYSTWSYKLFLGSETYSTATFDVSALSSQPINSIGVRP